MQAKSDSSVPNGTVICLATVSSLYILMSVSLVMLIPWQDLKAQPENVALSGFAYAFTARGMTWAKYIVSLGALLGIISSTAGGIFGMARIIGVFSRERLVPPAFGYVWDKTGVPVFATLTSGLAICKWSSTSSLTKLICLHCRRSR